MAEARFAMIAEGDVFDVMIFDELNTHPIIPKLLAGLRSNPIIVEVTDKPEVESGWTWDGEKFNPPASDEPFSR